MKKVSTLVLLALIVLANTLAWEKANAQIFSVNYTPRNGQGSIVLTSVVQNMDSTKTGHRIVNVSNNPSMTPIIQQIVDSFPGIDSVTFNDVLPVSVTYPTNFYVSEFVTATDTSVIIDTAVALPYVGVMVTPPFDSVTMVLQPPVSGVYDTQFNGVFTSGFDSAYLQVYVSYGDTTLAHPMLTYQNTITAVIGPNQSVPLSINLFLGSAQYLYSYQVHLKNSIDSLVSQIYSGTTLPSASPATVSTSYGTFSGPDSVLSYADVTTNGLPTRDVEYIAQSQFGPAIDSVVTMIPGQAGNTTVNTVNHNLASLTNYWVWHCVKNSLNAVPFCSNPILVQTTATPVIYTLAFDPGYAIGVDTYMVSYHGVLPVNDIGHVYALASFYQTMGSPFLNITLPSVSSGTFTGSFILTGLVANQTYAVTIYGNDDLFSRLPPYAAWDVIDTFTFHPVAVSGIHDDFDLEKSFSVFPNPITDQSTISINNPKGIMYEIIDMTGRVVSQFPAEGDKTTCAKGNLAPGVYMLVAQTESGKRFQKKIMVE